jgi:hypothetical protein
MDDDKVRELLARFRPAGPPVELRERVLGTAATPSSAWPWAAAAAALFAVTLGLHATADRSIASVAMPIAPDSVDALTEAMGGTDEARRAAELIVEEQRFREWLSPPNAITPTIEDELNRVN